MRSKSDLRSGVRDCVRLHTLRYRIHDNEARPSIAVQSTVEGSCKLPGHKSALNVLKKE